MYSAIVILVSAMPTWMPSRIVRRSCSFLDHVLLVLGQEFVKDLVDCGQNVEVVLTATVSTVSPRMSCTLSMGMSCSGISQADMLKASSLSLKIPGNSMYPTAATWSEC